MPSDATSLTATDTERRTKTHHSDLVPRHRTLDGFVDAVSQADGIGLTDVDAFATLVVRTDNSVQLLLPKGFEPPYQVVVGFAGLGTFQFAGSSDEVRLPDFVVRSGRALVLPVYKGSFERWDGIVSLTGEEGLLAWRDRIVEWYQDLARTLDYLETRSEFDMGRVAYFGGSFGANAPLPLLALESRFKAAILVSGGLSTSIPKPPEADPVNYLPRIEIPILMVNGRYDYLFPVETTQQPLMDLLGTPEEHKRHRIIEGAAHSVPQSQLIRETLDWLDKYLGPVN